MAEPVTDRSKHHRFWLVAVVLVLGWLALAASYYLVLPLFGVLSMVTWSLISVCWLWVIVVPVLAAGRLVWHGAVRLAVVVSLLAALTGAALWTLGLPQRTPEGQFRQHRGDLARLAADYRAGRVNGDTALPWRLRFLSVDGRAHHRCGSTDPQTGRKDCALFLLLWQDWRAESGIGFAYYPTRPGPDASILTAEGDIGEPVGEFGAGWWLVG
ncbi:hypothetical protein ACQEVC_24070 [Plantactinospora sp. CA-294935]|uniref:hypothetical protein n=1 Tax=Plantactinospora sp. CA-294935 TaxID=3240012 RepID=UPI003D8BE6D5